MAKKEKFNPFDHVGEADVSYDYNGRNLSIYFIDKYDFGDQFDKKQMTYIHADDKGIYLLLDEELYKEVPELYTQEALYAQYEYFTYRTSLKLSTFYIGGIGVAVVTFIILNFLFNVQNALSSSIIPGALFMVVYSVRVLKKDQRARGEQLRANMIKLMGEEKLDSLLDKQVEIARKRGYEV